MKYLLISFLVISMKTYGFFTETGTIQHNNYERNYTVIYPSDYSADQQYPALFYLHGLKIAGGTILFKDYSDVLANLADQKKTIIILPEAVPNFFTKWDNDLRGESLGHDDTGFIKKLFDKLITEISIDRKNVSVAGFSSGAFMASKLSIDLPGLFKSMILIAGGISQSSMTEYYVETLAHGRHLPKIEIRPGQGAQVTFSNLFQAMYENYPTLEELGYNLTPGFSPSEAIDRFGLATLLIHGEKDYLVPFSKPWMKLNVGDLTGDVSFESIKTINQSLEREFIDRQGTLDYTGFPYELTSFNGKHKSQLLLVSDMFHNLDSLTINEEARNDNRRLSQVLSLNFQIAEERLFILDIFSKVFEFIETSK